MQKILLSLTALLISGPLWAQKGAGVSGVVFDAESGALMAYVTVMAADRGGKGVASAISDRDGVFSLSLHKRGRYSLHFSFMGYSTMSQEIDFQGENIQIPHVELQRKSFEIEGVVVKPLIRSEVDRIVYDVGRDPDAAKMKMMRIMEKIPELRINPANGNLSYDNESIEKILFDGHEEGLISALRQYPMEFIKATVMSEIEVILPGSAQYNNTKPIINIKLAHELPNGVAWEISPSASTRGEYRAGIDAVSKVNAMGIGVNYQAGWSQPPKLQNDIESYHFVNQSRRVDHSDNWGKAINHNMGLNLFRPFANNKIRVNLTLRTSISESNHYANSLSALSDATGALLDRSESYSHNLIHNPATFNGGASFRYKINNSHGYSMVYSYTDNISNQLNNLETVDFNNDPGGRRSEGATGNRQHVANATYTYSKSRSSILYLYVNWIHREYYNTTDYYYYDYLQNDYAVDNGRYSGLLYTQNMANFRAAYIDALFNRMFTYRLEVNGEGVHTYGTFLGTGNTKLDFREYHFFPKIVLNYKIKTIKLNAGYETQVRRPGIDQLNPFIDDSNPNHVFMGNPLLRGSYLHRLYGGVDRSFKSKWNFAVALNYRIDFTNNAITSITTVNNNNVSITSYDNLARSFQEVIAFRLHFMPFGLFGLMNNIYYSNSRYSFPDGSTNRMSTFSGSSQAMIAIKDMVVNISYNYAPAYASAQNRSNSYYHTLNASTSHYFKKIYLGGSISCDNLLNSNKKVRETIGNNTFMQYADRQRIGRTFKISLYWRFGRFKDPDKNRPETVQGEVYDMGE